MEQVKSIVHLLVVEDDANDVLSLKRAFDRLGIACQVSFAINGDEAIELLSSSSDSSKEAQVPTHLILDLNLPKKSGVDVLHWLRQHPTLSGLPVFVFSSSPKGPDVSAATKLGVDGFRMKPMGFEGLLGIVGDIARSWGLVQR